ncbi:secretion protein HlyD [Siccirubricoccus deserti]|uniref:Efflux RND transporter periplasmic adaptor subunit n=1 Tax=Siccirubricoccus deserti TaxID=2013562 RepID=A0A9X0UGF1_9PROT|nr:efflux RND transporter periplasmic adaptor subunit [Siccirubricoccus deserti]MBC4018941.1 efflux RND transporter periplasmic adaptor subunit [Siccirubricoccus deserti]GGC69591.1 secretion protein HlyD [Siccirubricoccus deserti]
MLLVAGVAERYLRSPAPAWLAPGPSSSVSATAAAAGQTTPHPALAVAVALVESVPVDRIVVGDGSVVAWQELAIGAEIGGLRVVEVAVEEGDRVRQGQLLLRFDAAVPIAQVALAEAVVAENEAALQVARSDLSRADELSRGAIVTRQAVEQRQAASLQAEARLAAARARRDEAVARLAQTRILAPAGGVIARRAALLGAVPSAGQEMFRMVRDGRLELDAKVPELDLGAVRPGQAVRVVHGDREIEATVRAVAPIVDTGTRHGIVRVALPADAGLLPGMFARAEIRADTVSALAVPQVAVVFRTDAPAAFVLGDDGRVSLRRLAVGAYDRGFVEVMDGLRAGERVVVSGAGFLAEGDSVLVAPLLAAAP